MEKIKTAQRKTLLYFIITAILAVFVLTGCAYSRNADTAYAKDFPPTTLSVRYGKTKNGSVYRAELTAVYENKGLFAQNIRITVHFKETGEKTVIIPRTDAGYSPAIVLADFTGDGAEEVFL